MIEKTLTSWLIAAALVLLAHTVGTTPGQPTEWWLWGIYGLLVAALFSSFRPGRRP
jgi:hypothetical protein